MSNIQTTRFNEKQLASLEDTGKQITNLIKECLPATTSNSNDFMQSLVIARGVSDLKTLFLQSPEIRQVVMSMANNRLGFLTDRTPETMARNKQNGKYPNETYRYDQIVDPIIEGLLKGYRISNNEINIISGQFYAAKNGNYRRIIEWPNMANFSYNNSPPVYQQDGKTAKIKVWASWLVGEEKGSIGVSTDDELILQIKVNAYMGDDGIVGKAHSKLFKRVLERLSGSVIPESSDIDEAITVTHFETGIDSNSPETNLKPLSGMYDQTGDIQDDDKQEPQAWVCLESPVLQRYSQEKRELIRLTADNLGVDIKGLKPPAAHQKILDVSLSKSEGVEVEFTETQNTVSQEMIELTAYFNDASLNSKLMLDTKEKFNYACKAADISPGSRPTSVEQGNLFRSAYEEKEVF